MSKVKIQGNASGTGVLTVTAPNTSTDRTITLPDATGTLAVNSDVTNKLPLAGGTMTGMLDIATSNNATQIRLGDATSDTNKDSWIVSRNHTASEEDTALIHARCGDSEASLYLGGTDAFNTQNAVTDIRFLTAANTTTLNGTERMRVTNNGLTFNGDTAAANALDDYEEGTWTPTLTCTTSGSYVLQGGADLCAYTKVGRVVHIQGSISINGESSPNGNLRITLPLTAFTGTDDTDFSMGNLSIGNHGGNMPGNINAFVQPGAYFYPWGANDNGTTFYVAHDDVDTNFQIAFNFSYITSV